jgi:hypothetical protein
MFVQFRLTHQVRSLQRLSHIFDPLGADLVFVQRDNFSQIVHSSPPLAARRGLLAPFHSIFIAGKRRSRKVFPHHNQFDTRKRDIPTNRGKNLTEGLLTG